MKQPNGPRNAFFSSAHELANFQAEQFAPPPGCLGGMAMLTAAGYGNQGPPAVQQQVSILDLISSCGQ